MLRKFGEVSLNGVLGSCGILVRLHRSIRRSGGASVLGLPSVGVLAAALDPFP
jgi:hypothetical protein